MNQLISNFNSKNIYRQLILIFCLMGIMSTSAQTFTFADVAIIKNESSVVQNYATNADIIRNIILNLGFSCALTAAAIGG